MAASEMGIVRQILLAFSRGANRLFRQNVGVGWVGKVVYQKQNELLLQNARPLHAGLCEGSSDLIGWKSVEVTPEMVGRRLAVFVAVEVKSQFGRVTEEQTTFLDAVNRAGGIGIVARSVEDAQRGLG